MSADGPLARLSDYELRHLTAHLIASGRQEDLHRLLELEQPDGRNAWFEAKSASWRTGEYVADVAAAWQAARAAKDAPWQVRYALMAASVRSRWQYLPGRLLSACVTAGLVPWAEALSVIEQVPGLAARTTAIEELAPVMPEEGMPFLLDLALALTERFQRDAALARLAPHLPLALVRRALPAARASYSSFAEDNAIQELIFRLAELGELAGALELFPLYRSVPLALRLATVLDDADDQQRLFADDTFLAEVLDSGAEDAKRAVKAELVATWVDRVVAGPVDDRIARAVVASFTRLPGAARARIDPLALAANCGGFEQEVRALITLVPVLEQPDRNSALEQLAALVRSAPEAERGGFPDAGDDPVRARLCLTVAPVLAAHGDRGAALELARLAFETGLAQKQFTSYDTDWLGNALIRLADDKELNRAIDRVIASPDPWLRMHRMLAILPLAAQRRRTWLLPAIQAEIMRLDRDRQAEFLIRLLPWAHEEERALILTTALRAGGLLGVKVLDLPDLVATLPVEARQQFLDETMTAARAMKSADAAMAILALARSSVLDSGTGTASDTTIGSADLLWEAARLYRDALLESEHGPTGDWLPFTAEEIGKLDLADLLRHYQVVADDQAADDYETGLLRVLGSGTAAHAPGQLSDRERAALADYYAQAGDLTAAREYGPLTASHISLAIPAATPAPADLLAHVTLLPPEDQATACLDLAIDGPPDILTDIAAIAQDLDDPDVRGKILISAAERVADRDEAIRLAREAWTLAVETGVHPARDFGSTVLRARRRWLASAAVDILLPLLPGDEQRDLLRETLAQAPAPEPFHGEALLHLARLAVPELHRTILKQAQPGDRPEILAAYGYHDAALQAIERQAGRGGPRVRLPMYIVLAGDIPLDQLPAAVTAVIPYLPLEQLPRARKLATRLNRRGNPKALAAIARRMSELGKPDEAVELLRPLPSIPEGWDASTREEATGDLPILLARLGYLPQALEALDFRREQTGYGDTLRLDALTAMIADLVRCDPDSARQQVMAMDGAAGWLDRLLPVYAQALAQLSGTLQVQSAAQLSWDQLLGYSGNTLRGRALGILAAIRPLTRALGGIAAIEEEKRTVRLVRRWWP